RTVQRWQKEGGEARNISRSTPGLKISVQGIANEQQRHANARAFRARAQEQGLDVGAWSITRSAPGGAASGTCTSWGTP
ncbi:MAG: hypothetical protein M3Y74_20695, partial [Chloroflexota bacterium]|nr:hypothetical protein [Chloroflexota bacterium]